MWRFPECTNVQMVLPFMIHELILHVKQQSVMIKLRNPFNFKWLQQNSFLGSKVHTSNVPWNCYTCLTMPTTILQNLSELSNVSLNRSAVLHCVSPITFFSAHFVPLCHYYEIVNSVSGRSILDLSATWESFKSGTAGSTCEDVTQVNWVS